MAEIFGEHKAYDKLVKKIKDLCIKLGLIEEKQEEKKFCLVDIPDHELAPEKVKFKKMQMYQKKAWEERQMKAQQKVLEEQKMRDLR